MPPNDEDRRRRQNSSQHRDILIDQSPLVNVSGALSTSRASRQYARADSSVRRIFYLQSVAPCSVLRKQAGP
jgi:hypothetical protein